MESKSFHITIFWKCRLFPGLSAKFVIHGLRWGLFKTSASTFALSSASSYSGAHDRWLVLKLIKGSEEKRFTATEKMTTSNTVEHRN